MAAKPDHEAPGFSGMPPGQRVVAGGGRWRIAGGARPSDIQSRQEPLQEPVGGPARTAIYAVTIIRYADDGGGRVVLEFGEETDLKALLEHVIARCDEYGWIQDRPIGELGKGSGL